MNVNVIKDVAETHANYNDILAVQRAGIFDLDHNGNFLPNKEVKIKNKYHIRVVGDC